MFNRSRKGWIGVDLGDGSTKIAQLRRVRDRWELAAASAHVRSEATTLADHLKSARSATPGVRGDQAAALLSMRDCVVETADEEATVDAAHAVDQWDAGPGAGYAFRAPLAEVEAAVEGLGAAGIQCEVIDGLPLAVARALTLSPGYERGELLGALDLGESSVTFVAAKGGQAFYVRQLSCEAFAATRLRVAESLALSASEAAVAVTRYGVPSSDAPAEARIVGDTLRQAIRPVVQEMRRTYSHLGGRLKSKPPERLFLMGSGATTPGLAEAIGSDLGVEAASWRAAGLERSTDSDAPDCLFGPAIALSALAWETAA